MWRRLGRWAFPLVGLWLLAVAAYGTTWDADLLLWDDAAYVYRNEIVTQAGPLDALKAAFSSFQCSNYHPLTVLSHWAVYQVVGGTPWPHHLVNLLLHCLNSSLVFLLLRTLGLPLGLALFGAATFAVHPVNVSAVAWVAERKEVLCAFFILLSVVSWLRARSGLVLLISLLCGGLALLSKPTAVVLPLVLAAADLTGVSEASLRRKRWMGISLLMCAAGLVGALTWRAQAETAIHRVAVGQRATSALHSVGWYLAKALIPAGLSPHHVRTPHWDSWDVHAYTGAGLLIGIGLLSYVALQARWTRVTWGLIWYVVLWLPVSGVVRVGLAPVAERYLYLTQVGIWIALLSGALHLLRPIQDRAAPVKWPIWGTMTALAVGAVVVFFGMCVDYAGVWRGDELVWRHVLRHYPSSGLARVNLATYYASVADDEVTAVRLLSEVKPDDPDGQYKLAQLNLLILKLRALPLDPVLLARMERLLELPREKDNRLVREALVAARERAARLCLERGQYRTALMHCERGLRVRPGDPGLLYLQALAYWQTGRDEAARRIVSELEGRRDTPEAIRTAARSILGDQRR